MRMSDWSSDVCSSDLLDRVVVAAHQAPRRVDWIQERQIGLFEQVLPVPGVAAVAVAEVDDAVVADQVAGAQAGQVLAAELGIPLVGRADGPAVVDRVGGVGRSEEHTSELQSLMRISYSVLCLK